MTRLQLNESSRRTRPAVTSGPGSINPQLSSSNVSGSRPAGDRSSLTSSRSPVGDSNGAISGEQMVQSIQSVPGNDHCADCGASDPEWASLNLGAMVCISCSGIHRQLGTHISRVRSLHLDDWSPESVAVMCSIGNTLANSVWEAAVPVNAGNRKKPGPTSSREEKEIWIRAKYDRQEFLPPLPYPDAPLQQQLIDAIARQDTRQVILCLALATPDTVNAPYSRQDPRAAIHIAATLGNLVYLQLLLWYHGDPTVVDHEGRNAYYYAHCSQNYDCAEFLRRNGCSKQIVPPNATQTSGRPAHSYNNQLSMSGIQPQATHPSNVPVDPHGPLPFGTNSVVLPPVIHQPYHFSHLQQRNPAPPLVTQLTGGGAISHAPIGLTALAPVQSASAGQSIPTSHLSMLQSVSSMVNSNPQSTTNAAPVGLTSRPSVSGQVAGLCAVYNANVNQALGATLPRRRAPPSSNMPHPTQPFLPAVNQQHPIPSGMHRPFSGAVPDRQTSSNTALRSSSSINPSASSHTAASTYNRGTPNASAVSVSKPISVQQSPNQEVGL